jgi:hypothetical protein
MPWSLYLTLAISIQFESKAAKRDGPHGTSSRKLDAECRTIENNLQKPDSIKTRLHSKQKTQPVDWVWY